MSGIFRRFSGKKETTISPRVLRRLRHLLFEPLEERQMLSITAMDFNAIKAAYPDFNSTVMSEYNITDFSTAQVAENIVSASAVTSIYPVVEDRVLRIQGTNNADWVETLERWLVPDRLGQCHHTQHNYYAKSIY